MKSQLASDEELNERFHPQQVAYLKNAEKLVNSGLAKDVDDIQDELGYGIVDESVLEDTFFRD